jgi:hypothetical protein
MLSAKPIITIGTLRMRRLPVGWHRGASSREIPSDRTKPSLGRDCYGEYRGLKCESDRTSKKEKAKFCEKAEIRGAASSFLWPLLALA